jgi:hypothetical protein
METQCGRKIQNVFTYIYLIITFIRSTNFLFSPAEFGRRLQPPIFSSYNLRESPTPQFFGYNQKEARTPYVLQLQLECGYNHLSLSLPTTLKYKCQMMKPLLHCPCEIYDYELVPICANNL